MILSEAEYILCDVTEWLENHLPFWLLAMIHFALIGIEFATVFVVVFKLLT